MMGYAGEYPQSFTKQRLEYFWLCGEWAGEMTLAFRKGVGIVPVPSRGFVAPTVFLRHDSA